MRRIIAAPAAALLVLLPAAPAASAAPDDAERRIPLTLMATTDVHGHVVDWDYFQNAPFPADDALGLTRVATAVDQVRAEKGAESVVVLDNGDAIQGTPLTYFYGMGDGAPSVLSGELEHPMATAFDAIGYDAQVVGNHEYNYGLDLLAAYEQGLDAPLLGANVIDVATGEPYHEPYTLIDREIDGETVTIGVLGVVTPGVRVWDKAIVDGVLEFRDVVETAAEWVPVVEEQADVVVVLAHTGKGTTADADYDPALLEEDAARNIASQVPGIDVVVAGHSHQDEPEEVVENAAGEKVLITQPEYWARSASQVDLTLVADGDGFRVDWSDGHAPVVVPHYGREGIGESAGLAEAVQRAHDTTVSYVNTPVATSTEELRTETSRYEDTPIIDFISEVQAETVANALDTTEYADLPVLSQASPFSRTARFPQGEVTIRDLAGLYIYENTLLGVVLTGAQVQDYLEHSARYFVQTEEGAEFDPENGTNARYEDAPEGIPDYAYDVLTGLDYTIDISQPVGERITGLRHPDGTPVSDDEQFVLAVNNYRQSGGSGYPHVAEAPVVYDERLEIRQLLVDWAQSRGVIDPADFFTENWSLTTSPVEEAPSPAPTPEPTAEPTAAPSPEPTAEPTAAPSPAPTAAPSPEADEDAPLAPTSGSTVIGTGVAGVLVLGAGAVVLAARRRRV
ncbi:5'-nucleotidase C-terminal domain-containing protein [Microbacterium sp. JZ37]|uniref:5'-nucleotidase C-terminal domain-containing protein n=1 Tax=Microbacterium sp. JZ37 TaxID=2654193 RepID=UPI002B489894|nr:5'-nucleotidase C-terminal domain-containing protein [Microbacterium sp. JZ37]WRH16468.1 bifunctional metallophosphatase/5'-nucleotidase [Microbacterium sp. JZ37]